MLGELYQFAELTNRKGFFGFFRSILWIADKKKFKSS